MEKLINLNRGQTFTFAGHEWIILETYHRAVLVLMKNLAKYGAFDRQDRADWRGSTARKFLNIVFLEELETAAGDQADRILSMEVDLKAADGTFRETSTDRVALLTIEQYRRHRDIIEPIGAVWWTLTRETAVSHDYLLAIRSDGTILNRALAHYSHTGIRPTLLLASDTLVDVIEDSAQGTPTEATAATEVEHIEQKETADVNAVAAARQ